VDSNLVVFEMEMVAVFLGEYVVNSSPAILNLLGFLSETHEVHFYFRNVALVRNIPVLKEKNIKVISLDTPTSVGYRMAIPLYLRNFVRRLNLKLKLFPHNYSAFIVIDPHGFVLCKEYFPQARPVYYSLELYMSYDHYGLYYPKELMDFERRDINKTSGLIIQSEGKNTAFREDYKMRDSIPSFLLPITYKTSSVRQKANMIREKYNIDSSRKIALHFGGIAPWYSCIEIALMFSALDDWVLFFQGYPCPAEYLEELKCFIRDNNINNVIVTEETYEALDDVDKVLMSCDLGIAWYNDISVGFRMAGKSSGKISAYFRFGLPVIVNSYPDTVEAVEKTGCGVCVDSIDSIPEAINIIESDYNGFAERCYEEYDKTYRFDVYASRLYDFIFGE